jgi:hypothetical protein
VLIEEVVHDNVERAANKEQCDEPKPQLPVQLAFRKDAIETLQVDRNMYA